MELTKCLTLQRQVFIALYTYSNDYAQYPCMSVPCNAGDEFDTYLYPDGGFCQRVVFRWINGYSGLKCLLEDKGYIAQDMTRRHRRGPHRGAEIAWYDLSPSPPGHITARRSAATTVTWDPTPALRMIAPPTPCPTGHASAVSRAGAR